MNHKKKISLNNLLLENIASAMHDNSWEMVWYLDLEEEDTTVLFEYGEEDEELEELIESDTGQERFIPVPKTSSHGDWNQMDRFIDSLEKLDEKTRNLLHISIEGKGAFGRFKDTLFSIGMLDRWYEFKNRQDTKEALDWLYSEDLITEDDIEKGMQLYEEALQKRKARKEEIGNMTKGVKVICTGNHGHGDKLTIGKTYNILEDRNEDLLLRIRDDRGRKVWLPKSHFQIV